MSSPPLPRFALIASLAVSSLFLHAACARSGTTDPEPESFGLFTPDSGVVGSGLCVETACPPPFATCPDEPGLCTTNLSNDVEHCGACNTRCPSAAKSNGSFVCSEGECKLACKPLFGDCNHTATDGCETPTASDPANCGGCGITCNEGDICWRGACGCPNGYTACGTECKKLDSDDLNCSACGNVCHAPSDDADPAWRCGPKVMPANTKWTCMSSACGLSCKGGFGDCNNLFCNDGCEVDLRTDPANCGACGNQCAAGQSCDEGTCLCPTGTVNCNGSCVDLQNDARNCGVCGLRCPGPTPTTGRSPGGGSPVCEAGECSYKCFPGFADCDGDLYNGCEANLQSDPRHCGACGTKCNVAAGQPCVVGQCLTRECDAGVVN